MPEKYTLYDFIKKANKVHNNIYDYSSSIYVNNKIKLTIICKKHGAWETKPDHHLNSKSGCPKCGRERATELTKHSTYQFIENAKNIHGDKYMYDLVEYKQCWRKVKIICPNHGVFEQSPTSHVKNGSGCPKCAGLCKLTTKDFIIKSKMVHGDRYDYSQTKYGKSNSEKVNINCVKHGIFSQTPANHMFGFGCPKCNYSKGEIEISNFLIKNKISFEYQKVFKDCIDKRALKFDFYLENFNLLIEFDGQQHFNVSRWSKNKELMNIKLSEVQRRDEIKNNYAKQNNINLIRIKYTDISLVNEILSTFFKIN